MEQLLKWIKFHKFIIQCLLSKYLFQFIWFIVGISAKLSKWFYIDGQFFMLLHACLLCNLCFSAHILYLKVRFTYVAHILYLIVRLMLTGLLFSFLFYLIARSYFNYYYFASFVILRYIVVIIHEQVFRQLLFSCRLVNQRDQWKLLSQ
jgi:hypothetical protein